MKRYLLWSFERGSKPYDIICGIILVFIFLTPTWVFDDRPDYMRLAPFWQLFWPAPDPTVRNSYDDKGNPVYTVKLQTGVFASEEDNKADAVRTLAQTLKIPADAIKPTRMEPVYDYTGELKAYAVWMQR